MTIRGTVTGGVIVFDNAAQLPDGTEVSIVVPPSRAATSDATIWDKLAQLGRDMEKLPTDLPDDLAANHDHYLHGLPKRQ